MRGNALGWSISAVIVLLAMAIIGWVQWSATTTTPRTDFSRDSSHGAPIVWPADPDMVLPDRTDPSNAAELIREAIAIYQKNPDTYRRFVQGGKPEDFGEIPAVDCLTRATHCVRRPVFGDDPAQLVNLSSEKPPLAALNALGDCMVRAAMLIEKDKPADSIALYEATFSLGMRLYEERLTYAELDTGLSLMAKGSTSIARLSGTTGDTARARRVNQFDQARKTYVIERILPMMRILSTIDQPTLEAHYGDVLYFARHAQDRLWRVEAIFALARYRFNAVQRGDQNIATVALKELAAREEDPIIRLAAIAGRDATMEQYRMLK